MTLADTSQETFLAELVVPGVDSSVRLVRHSVALALQAAGHQHLDGVRLTVSELTTNAILHTRSGWRGGLVVVGVLEVGSRLARIEVTDEGSVTMPRPRRSGVGECRGRGLWLVAETSARWGVRRGPMGATVWAEVLTTEPAPSAAPDSSACVLEA
ncbi:ATP-binding protein [Nonomuraea sp. NPDC002799]